MGTPGRIKDHIQNSKLDLSNVKHVVLDEVDHMLDMGFAEQVEEILGFAYKKGKFWDQTWRIWLVEDHVTVIFHFVCKGY